MNAWARELVDKLESDAQLNFKRTKGKYLQQGTCPGCGRTEVFISRDEPWVLKCNRANNCGYSESTRERYPELFESFTERFPVTEDDPEAPARAYLTYNRGFRATKVSGWYCKGIRTLFDGNRRRVGEVLTVRFPLWGEHYWERIIDRKDIERNGGKKAHISYGCDVKGKGWTPPEQAIVAGDWVFITEGIFQSIALSHLNPDDLAWPLKVVATLSCNNLPRELIEANKGKGIHWVLAYDHDSAGMSCMRKFVRELRGMGEQVHVALGKKQRDWDDEWRAGLLNQSYLDRALWQGAIAFCDKPSDVAFWHHMRFPRQKYYRFAYQHALYRAALSDKGEEILNDYDGLSLNHCWARDATEDFCVEELRKELSPCFNVHRIANCHPEFLYIQKDRFTKEQQYFFRVTFLSGNPEVKIAMDGAALESPAAFNKMLLKCTPGGTFDGTSFDLKYLRELWFDHKATEVQTLSFAGYDSDSGLYVFPEFGYYKGQRLMPNSQGYLQAGDRRVKTLQQVKLSLPKGNLHWGGLFLTAFQLDGMALMSWWLGTLFSEQIRAKYQSWTFFELTGDWGAGKSTLLETLWRCVGMDQEEGFDPNKSSPAGRARRLVQLSNLPSVLIEGDRDGDSGQIKQTKFHLDELKTAYNGRSIRSRGIATQDANTNEMPFRGGICISQNATVSGSDALLGRLVHCHATREHHSEKTRAALQELIQLPTEALAMFMDRALRLEQRLFTTFEAQFTRLYESYKTQAPSLSERILKNHAQVAAWGCCLPLIFDEQQIPSAWLNKLEAFLLSRAQDRQRRLDGDPPLVEFFWEIYDAYNIVDGPAGEIPLGEPEQRFNLSNDPHSVAINLIDFKRICAELRLPLIDTEELKKVLPFSRRYPFVAQKNVKHNGRARHCWVFTVPQKNLEGVREIPNSPNRVLFKKELLSNTETYKG